MRRKEYSRCYFCWYKLKFTGCWSESCDGTGASSRGHSNCHHAPQKGLWDAALLQALFWGAGRLQGIEAGTVFFPGWTFRWWKEPNSSPIYSGTTGLLVLVGRELLNCSVVSFIFLSWRVCLEADGVSSLWGDTEPLAEGPCKMCNLHHRRWPWKMVYVQTQWGVSSATAYEE